MSIASDITQAAITAMQNAIANNISSVQTSLADRITSLQNQAQQSNDATNRSIEMQINKVMQKAADSQAKASARFTAQFQASQNAAQSRLDAVMLGILKPSIDLQTRMMQSQLAQRASSDRAKAKLLADSREEIKEHYRKLNEGTGLIGSNINDVVEKLFKMSELMEQLGSVPPPKSEEDYFTGYDSAEMGDDGFNPLNPFQFLFDGMTYVGNRMHDFQKAFDDLEKGEFDNLDDFRDTLFGSRAAGELGDMMFFMILLFPLFKEIMQASYAKHFTELNFLAIRKAQPARTNVGEAFRLYQFGLFTYDEFEDNLLDAGWSEETILKLFQTSQSIPTLNDLYELYRRKIIDRDELEESIKKWGFTPKWIERMSELYSFIPPVQDVIRFMVRDVFDEELAELSGIFEGWDNPEYLKQAERSGIAPEDAKNYWAAHWILPSFNQGFELFQREIINRDELEALFRAGDLAHLWRDKMMSISFNLPTRVDVRRAYEDGVIDDEKLKEFLRHSGVDPNWQGVLFDWHVARRAKVLGKGDASQTFSLSQIIKGFINEIFTESQAIERLVLLGWDADDARTILRINDQDAQQSVTQQYRQQLRLKLRKMGEDGYRTRTLSHEDASMLLIQSGIDERQLNGAMALIDTQYLMDRKSEIVQASRKLYLGYEISENIFFDILNTAGFSQNDINSHLSDLRPLRELRYRELTRADIRKGSKLIELGIEWGKDKLKGLGYSDITIAEIILIEGWVEPQVSEST